MEILVPILLADILNPVLLAFMIYAVGTSRGLLNSCAALLGHTLAYFAAGIVLLGGIERIGTMLANPGVLDYGVGLFIGVLLLVLASLPDNNKKKAAGTRVTEPALTPLKALAYGGLINFIGIPFALPYFAAVDQIIKADLTLSGSLTVLLAYNLAYAAPFLLVPILTAVMGENSRQFLQRMNAIVDKGSAVLMPILLGFLGGFLVLDALSYFVRGVGLI